MDLPSPTPRLRILIADDDPWVLETYALTLGAPWRPAPRRDELRSLEADLFGSPSPAPDTPPSYDLCLVSQGADAVARVTEALDAGAPYAVAFLDVRMPPGLDGVSAAAEIRRIDPHVNIVIATGYTDQSPSDLARLVPGSDRLLYLRKPWDPDEVRQIARALCEQWSLRGALERSRAELLAANARLKEEEASLRRAADRFTMLHEALLDLAERRLPGDVGPEEAARAIVEVSARSLEVERVDVWLPGRPGTLRRAATLRESAARSHPDVDRASAAELFLALDTEVVIADALLLRPLVGDQPPGTALAAPVRMGGAAAGALCVAHTTRVRGWGAEELSFLVAAANLLSRVIEAYERQAAERALHRSEERYALAAQGARDGVWDWDLTTGAVFYSSRWQAIVGAEGDVGDSPEEWLGRVHPDDRPRVNHDLEAHMASPAAPLHVEHRIAARDGSWRWVLCRGEAVRDEHQRACRLAGSLTDITAYKDLQERLSHDAMHDSLTGLPNRRLLLDRLQRAISRANRGPTRGYAVLYADVDRFKGVNDSLGHRAGDGVLTQLSTRLNTCVRACDTVARVGGDEFVILLEDTQDSPEVSRVAERIHAELRKPFPIEGGEVYVGVSIGIVLGSRERAEPEAVVRDAETAMYRAKASLHHAYVIFDPAMHEQVATTLSMETELRRAVESEELRLVYQPIVTTDEGRIVGFEALARWTSPRFGVVSPMTFIPLAESSGLIVALGWQVLRRACVQARAWLDLLGPDAAPTVAVNLSYKQLVQPGFVEQVEELLRDLELPARYIKAEITESMIIESGSNAPAVLNRLKEVGFSIVLDDFGTGYSSLSYLQRFPVDTVKIDRSFIMDMHQKPGSMSIVRAVVSLARELGLDVVAEGVETSEHRQTLQALRCRYSQGYLFSRPLEADAATRLIEEAALSEAS